MIQDALLHHIWKTNWKYFPKFQDLVDKIQITARETRNKEIDTVQVLKYITWNLSINITHVKIISRPPRKTGHKLFCFCYSFQNTFVKLFKKSNHLKPVHIISFKKKYYILNEQPTIFPLLLKRVNPQTQLTYKMFTIRTDHILDIVKGKKEHLTFPFTINVYTAYSSIEKQSKEIQNNIIGQFSAENTEEVFSVFLTPDIEKSDLIRINALDSVKHSVKFDKHNLFANAPITEGAKTVFCRTPKEILLDQEACICDHEQTREYYPSKRDRNLGISHN